MKRKTSSELKVVKGKILTELNSVRNSSGPSPRRPAATVREHGGSGSDHAGGALNSALRGGTPYGSEPGIILKSNPQPRCSRRPRLRPRGASAPEGGPLARREQQSIISNGVKNYLGLCSCCSYAPDCTYPRESGRPILECNEFDGISPPLNKMMKWMEKPLVNRFSGPIPDAQRLSILRGLCAYCDGLNTCTYPKPEGGVWHCEEYC